MPDDAKLVPTQFKLTVADKRALSWIATVLGESSGCTLPLAASDVIRRLIRPEAARLKKSEKKSSKV